MSTQCIKNHIGKLTTYRITKETIGITSEQIDNKTHAQIDFVIASHRWRNPITNAESDTRANLHSDRFPFYLTARIRFKEIKKGGQPRPIYKQCDNTQQDDLNYELWNTIPTEQNNNNNNRYKVIKDRLKQGIPTLPKATPKDRNKKI